MLRASLVVIAAAVAASSVKGSGTISFGNSVEHISVNTSGSSGRATFNDRTASGNVNGTIQINCVRIVGNEATLSGIVTHTNRKAIEGFEALFQIRDNGRGRGGNDDKGKHEGDDKGKDKEKDKGQNKNDDKDNRGGNAKDRATDMASLILFHAVGTGSNCQIPGEFDLVQVKGDFSVRP
jgi:hypothetical protein